MTSTFAGDFSLKSIILTSNKIATEIKDVVHELNLYESINSATISADLVIHDTKNFISSLPIIGGEEISINVSTSDRTYILYFVVYKLDSKVIQEKSMVYILRLSTIDTIKNETSHYSLRHKNQFLNNIVTDLLKNKLGTQKKIDADKCIYPINFVNPNRRIFDTIQWLSRKSIPEQNVESCGFLFFETLSGYKFKSIDNMMSRRSQNENDPFTYTQAKTSVNGVQNRNRIIKYVSDDYFDVLEKIRLGGLSHYNMRLDFNKRDLKISKSTLKESWNHFSHLGGGVPTDNTLFDTPSRIIFTPILNDIFGNSTVGDPSDTDKINKLIDRSVYRYTTLDAVSLNVEIPGNLDVRAGNVYTLLFPSVDSEGADRDRNKDGNMSGDWLCHSVKSTISRGYCSTIVRFCRDSIDKGNTLISGGSDTEIMNIG